MKSRIMLAGLAVVVGLAAGGDRVCAMAGGDVFVCDDSYQGIVIEGNVIVPLDEECDLSDAVVFGDIQIVQGGVSPLRFATLVLDNTVVHGNVRHNAADTVEINGGSVVHGSVTNLFNNHPMSIGGRTSVEDATIHGDLITVRTERVEIADAVIGGGVKIENSDDRVRIDQSEIGLTVELNNNADIRVMDNFIGGDLLCSNNDDVIIDGNTVEGVINCNGIVDPPCVAADLNCDHVVDIFDLLIVLSSWGPCEDCAGGCPADLTGDCVVDIFDLLAVLSAWG